MGADAARIARPVGRRQGQSALEQRPAQRAALIRVAAGVTSGTDSRRQVGGHVICSKSIFSEIPAYHEASLHRLWALHLLAWRTPRCSCADCRRAVPGRARCVPRRRQGQARAPGIDAAGLRTRSLRRLLATTPRSQGHRCDERCRLPGPAREHLRRRKAARRLAAPTGQEAAVGGV